MRWSLALVAIGLLMPVRASAAEAVQAVEEWQVRGILAGLKDGYPQVRALASASQDQKVMLPPASLVTSCAP
jgi:hypothetical protein